MAYDPQLHGLILFGGLADENVSDGTPDLDDTWLWKGTTWRLLSNTGPIPRCDATSGYDNTTGQFLLFGGYTNTNLAPNPNLNDTWQLTASTGS